VRKIARSCWITSGSAGGHRGRGLFGGIFFTTLMPICARKTEVIDNETMRSLSFPIYRGLLNPRVIPFFEIAQYAQVLAMCVIYNLTMGVYSLAAMCIMHICGQIRILMLRMEDLADGRKRKSASGTVKKNLGDIVRIHIRIHSGNIDQLALISNSLFFNGFYFCIVPVNEI